MADDNPYAQFLEPPASSPASSTPVPNDNPYAAFVQKPEAQPSPASPQSDETGLRGLAERVPNLAGTQPWASEKAGYLAPKILHDALLAPSDIARGTLRGVADIAEGLTNPQKAQRMNEAGHLTPDALNAMLTFEGARAPGADVAPPDRELRFPEMSDRLKDFEKSGITPNVPAVTQNPTAGMVARTMRDTPIVGSTVSSAIQQNVGEAARASRAIADQFGNAMTPEEGGQALKEGYQAFKGVAGTPPPLSTALSTPTRNIGFVPKSEALYNAIPIAQETPAQVSNTLSELTSLRTKFPSNPDLGEMMQNPKFSKFAEALTPRTETIPAKTSSLVDAAGNPIVTQPAQQITKGGLNWDDLKQFRTYVGQQMRKPVGELGLGPDDWKSLYGAVSSDIKGTAADQGPDALKAFNQANNYYRAGISRLNDALDFIDRAASPEGAFYKMTDKASARGRSADINGLQATLKSLPDEFRDDATSAVINRLGYPTKGAAGANAENFSIGTWASNYANISDRAKDVMFGPSGTERRDSLDALSRSMNALKNVERLGNQSGTAREAITAGTLGAAIAAPVSTSTALAAQYLGANALMSPVLTRWLANSTKVTTQAGWDAQLARMNNLASRYPALVPYAAALQAQRNSGQQQP